jgi:4-hydroxythreonine-4-phosphate dehydrogenase
MKRIAITMGDPAGIGPEIIEKALRSGELPAGFEFQVIGNREAGTPGRPDQRSARAALDALHEASDHLNRGECHAVVTGPVSKQQLQSVGFPFPGQTEFFAHAAGIEEVAMCLTGRTLTVALATVHTALANVPKELSTEGITRTGLLLAAFLQRRNITRPRIAVAGLNPHAGEGGAFGDEESSIIAPAIKRLNQTDVGIFSGPEVPDAVFRDAAHGRFDAVLAMYHDQGLIPLKLLDFDTAVNVTLGLPKPRTSPDHGTAFGIAGKGVADPSSMIHAIRLACELA